MLGYFSLYLICSSNLAVLRSRKGICFSEQIISADKYPSILSRQMKAFVYIYLNLWNLYPFIYLKPEKLYPLRVEPPRVGSYSDFPPPPPSKKWLDTTIQARFPFCTRICSRNEEKTNCIVHCASHYHILILSFSLTVLDGLQYSPEEKKNILNEYYHRLEEELLSSPEYYMLLTLWNAFIIIEKS